MGAYHTSELQYLFPLFRGGQGTAHPLNTEQEKLSDAMVDYWTNFARSGSPNGARSGEGPPAWNRYSVAEDNVQILDLPAPRAATPGYGRENACELWDTILSWN